MITITTEISTITQDKILTINYSSEEQTLILKLQHIGGKSSTIRISGNDFSDYDLYEISSAVDESLSRLTTTGCWVDEWCEKDFDDGTD